jgi:hypothetical protein
VSPSKRQFRDIETAEKEERVTPPAYVTIAKTERPERPWDVCGLFENVYDASDAAGSLYGVNTMVCRLVPISRDGDGETRICRLCGEPFEPVRHNQIYCNPKCRTQAEIGRKKLGHRQRSQGRR